MSRSLSPPNAQPQYLVEPPPWGLRNIQEQEAFNFRITLFGNAQHHMSLVILAWQRAFMRGLHKTQDGIAYSTAMLQHITLDNGQTIYQTGGSLQAHPNGILPAPPAPAQYSLVFHTPVRINESGNIRQPHELTPARLIRNIQQRAQSLGLTLPPTTVPSGITHTHQMHWRDWERKSSRQQQTMPMGGFVGRIHIHGSAQDTATLWQTLWAGQWLHIGKNTVFGLGRYTLHDTQSLQQTAPNAS